MSEQIISVQMSAALVERMIGPWYLLKKHETVAVRDAFREALNKEKS